MAFKVFLSYGTDADAQVTALRLQTLATTCGINVTVPQRYDVHYPSAQRNKLEEHVRRAIDQSDCVLAIMTGTPGRAMQRRVELRTVEAKGYRSHPAKSDSSVLR